MSTQSTADRFETLRTHVDDPEELLTFAERSTTRTDLVVAPEQLHRRSIKRRLATQNQPRSSIRFVGPTQIAREIVEAEGKTAKSLDRIDRIRAIETLVETEPAVFSRFKPLLGTKLATQATDIEAIRSAIDSITSFDPDRIAALKRLAEACQPTVRRDVCDQLGGALATEQLLTEMNDSAVSSDAVVRTATDDLRDNGAELWQTAYSEVERVHLAGVSAVGAPLLDLLSTIASETTVDVHLFLRAGTGPRLAARLDGQPRHTTTRRAIDMDDSVSVTEMVTATRAQESRAALVVIDRLLSAGISPSDVVIVARDIDTYETELRRAARQYGQPVSLWTQLNVTETGPYRLFETVCTLLDQKQGRLRAERLVRALAVEWIHPDTIEWSPAGHELSRLQTTLDVDSALTLDEWREQIEANETPAAETARLERLLTWLAEQPTQPEPADVTGVFEPLFGAYRREVLPTHRDRDDAALTATTETARALVRTESLVEEVATKYEEWLEREQTEQSWEAVRYLGETIATVKPGRREHANARAIDVVDGTDTWLRQIPHVIVLGLVDGEWPQQSESLLPVEVRDSILAGETEATRTLSARERWTEDREYDHFADTVSMATEHLLCLRHQRNVDGTRVDRSVFLDALTPAQVSADATRQLLSRKQQLPAALAPATGDSGTDNETATGERGR